ncbi:MAG: DUF1826 domain-containing protein [Rheinheimera sp.]|nr:DUF1826 domain-containing protein [Rheinheimera sp.]
MTIHFSKMMFTEFQPLGTQIRQSADINVLSDILAPEVNLAVWQRRLDAELLWCAAQLAARPAFALQRQTHLADLPALLQYAVPVMPGSGALCHDIVLQAQMLACLMDTEHLGVRLKALHSAMCPRFHTDHVALRMLVTYAGPATEWRAGPDSGDLTGALRVGDSALLKGSAWPAATAVWHRSPPGMAARLLLTLDPL